MPLNVILRENVILSEAKNLQYSSMTELQILRFAQNDNVVWHDNFIQHDNVVYLA